LYAIKENRHGPVNIWQDVGEVIREKSPQRSDERHPIRSFLVKPIEVLHRISWLQDLFGGGLEREHVL
jgi:hypothetical protein